MMHYEVQVKSSVINHKLLNFRVRALHNRLVEISKPETGSYACGWAVIKLMSWISA